jgi:hypothetical protein
MKLPRPLLPVALALACAAPFGHAATIDFEDVAMPNEQAYAGGGRYWAGGIAPPFGILDSAFVSGGAAFHNRVTDFGEFGAFWSGFAYSNTTDTTTPGFGNQYSAWPGSGAGGSADYAVAFADGFNPAPRIAFAMPTVVAGTSVANTTYAALFMYDGDAIFAQPPFGGAGGDAPDYLLLTVTGRDAANAVTGTVDFYLADFRDPDDANDYIIDSWAYVALGTLGAVSALEFSLSSSNPFTPFYVALDDLQLVPLPAAAWLLAPALGLLLTRRRRC